MEGNPNKAFKLAKKGENGIVDSLATRTQIKAINRVKNLLGMSYGRLAKHSLGYIPKASELTISEARYILLRGDAMLVREDPEASEGG